MGIKYAYRKGNMAFEFLKKSSPAQKVSEDTNSSPVKILPLNNNGQINNQDRMSEGGVNEMVMVSINLLQGVSEGNFQQAKRTFEAFSNLPPVSVIDPVGDTYAGLEFNLKNVTGLSEVSLRQQHLIPRARVESELEKLAESIVTDRAIVGINYKNVEGSSETQYLTVGDEELLALEAPSSSVVGADINPIVIVNSQQPNRVALISHYRERIKKPLQNGQRVMEVKVILIESPKGEIKAPEEVSANTVDFPSNNSDQIAPNFNSSSYLDEGKKAA